MPNLRQKTWTETTPATVEDAQFWEDHLYDGSGTGGGHVIYDQNGNELPQRDNLKFVNATVTDDGTFTVVNAKGERGEKGDDGKDGKDGLAATIAVGTVTTLPYGYNATVTNVGTSSQAIFDFGIPKGKDGEGGGGTSDYNNLDNKPSINNVTLIGNKTLTELGALQQSDLDPIREKIADIELFKFPNVTIFGQPTINNGQISNFNATNYCQFPFVVDFQNQPFTLDFEITTGAEVTQQHNVFDSLFGLAFAVRNSKFVVAISTNGTTWNVGEGVGTHTVNPSSTYRVRMSWDLSNFVVSYSTDGGASYVTDITKALTSQPYPKQIYIGVTSDKSTFFNGIINLNYATLTIANKVVWSGMDDVGLASRLAVDMSNIDSAGEQKVKDIVGSIPSKTSDLTNDSGFITSSYHDSTKQNVITDLATIRNGASLGATALQSYTETDPVYTADKSKIALKSELPTKTSQLTNDSGYLTSYTETDPTVPSHVKSITSTNITNWNNKQNALVSGTNIKTINNESILGSGNITIQGGGASMSSFDVTLLASGWSSNTYTITNASITNTSVQMVTPALNITDAQLSVLQGANIIDGGQTNGSLTIIAKGTTPTENVPIRVIVLGSL